MHARPLAPAPARSVRASGVRESHGATHRPRAADGRQKELRGSGVQKGQKIGVSQKNDQHAGISSHHPQHLQRVPASATAARE